MFGYFWLSYIWKIDFHIFREGQRKKSYRFHRSLHRNEPWQHLHLHQGHVTGLTVPYITEKRQERSTLDVEGIAAFLGDTNEHFQTLACPTVMWKPSSMSNWWEKRTKNRPHLLAQYGDRLCSKCIMVNLHAALSKRWKRSLMLQVESSNVGSVLFQDSKAWRIWTKTLILDRCREVKYG